MMRDLWSPSKRRRGRVWSLCVAVLVLATSGSAMAQCRQGVVTTAANLSLGASVTVDGNPSAGSGNILPSSGTRTAGGKAAPTPNPATFPSYSGGGAKSGTNIAPGTYTKVTGSPTSFSGGGTYFIGTLTSGASTTFNPGTYYINTWTLPASASVVVNGAVQIYIGAGGVAASTGLSMTDGGGGSGPVITLYNNESFVAGDSSSVTATILGDGASTVSFGNGVSFTGLIDVGGDVSFGNGSTITSDPKAGGSVQNCSPVLDYHFEETVWNGTAGEVKDFSGNAYNGASKLAGASTNRATPGSTTPAVAGSPGTCAYGMFAGTQSPAAAYTYVEIPAAFPSLTGSFTVGAWIRSSNVGQGGQRVFVNDDADNGFGLSLGDGGSGKLRLFNRNITPTGAVTGSGGGINACGVFCLDTNAVISNNTWYYVATSVDTTASTVTVYVYNAAGTLLANPGSAYSGTWKPGSGLYAIGGETASSSEGRQAGFHFQGWIDEPQVVASALSQTSIDTLRQRTRVCSSSSVSSFTFTGTGGASTCSPRTIAITAHDAAGAVLTTYAGTMTLSTTTGHGTWALSGGSGTFTAGGADSGGATYTFAAADKGVASFTLADTRAESLSVVANDVSAPASSSSAAITFTDNAFVVAPSDSLGYEVVARRPHAFTAGFYKKDPSTGICSVAAGYVGAKPVDMWYTATGNHPAGAGAPTVSSSANAAACVGPVALPSAPPPANPASNLITLNFSAGVAPFYLCDTDVGQFAIGIRDDTLSYAASAISGVSSTATVRPFALWIDTVSFGGVGNVGGTASSGSKFAPAQSSFSAHVTAKAWSAGQDSVAAGVPNAGVDLSGNAATASFSAPVALSPGAQTPAAGVLGTLTGGSLAAGSFSAGVSSPSALAYSEAGSMTLSASSPNYLGSGFSIPAPATGNIGRFYPSSMVLASSTIGQACAAGGFTYMGQSFSVAATLNAVGSTGGLLSNYDAAKGYVFTSTPVWHAVDSASGVDLGARLSTGAAPTWTGGSWVYSYPAAVFARLAAPDGQYDGLVLGLSGADPDGASIGALDMSYTAAGACSGAGCNAKSVGASMRMRFGRLELSNTYGSVLNYLRVPVQTQYWLRTTPGGAALGWATNNLDSCTAIPYADMALGSYSGGLASATLPSGSLMLSSGKGVVVVTRPGNSAVSGSVILGVNLGSSSGSPSSCTAGLPSVPGANKPWLQSNFCSGSYMANPNARIVWGSRSAGSNSIIFQRETY